MIEVHHVATARADANLLAAIRRLLFQAFADFGDDDWLHATGGDHVVVTDGGAVVAHAAVVPRRLTIGDRAFRTGYVEAVATAPDRRGQDLGTTAMTVINDVVRARFELGALSTGAHRFYEPLGWERWRGPTYVRDGERVERTVDEDAGVMVLRTGPSAAVDLTDPIACERRPGDDW